MHPAKWKACGSSTEACGDGEAGNMIWFQRGRASAASLALPGMCRTRLVDGPMMPRVSATGHRLEEVVVYSARVDLVTYPVVGSVLDRQQHRRFKKRKGPCVGGCITLTACVAHNLSHVLSCIPSPQALLCCMLLYLRPQASRNHTPTRLIEDAIQKQ